MQTTSSQVKRFENFALPTSADLLLDSSAAIAFVQRKHEFHIAVHSIADGHRLGMAGHAAAELVSVLTRMPPPQRVSGRVALDLLTQNFPHSVDLGLSLVEAVRACVEAGVVGGAMYDGIVGLAARESKIRLASVDARALSTYRALGVPLADLPPVS